MSEHRRGIESVSVETVVFREITAEDYTSLKNFLESNDVPVVVRTFNPFPMTSETARRIACTSRQDRYYGAFLSERIVGLSMLRGWDEGYTAPSFGIMVDHRFHGLGIGARMLDYTIEQAQRPGCRRIRLSVYASNHAAVKMYVSRGFVEDSRESVSVNGEPDYRIVMFRES